ncbi:hypothetical protein ACSS6W_009652 [Trichoderma asperelloides]
MISNPLIDPMSDSFMPALRRERTHPTHTHVQCTSTSNLQKGRQIRGRPSMLGCGAVYAAVSYIINALPQRYKFKASSTYESWPSLQAQESCRWDRAAPRLSTAPITGRRPHGTASTKILTTPLFVSQRQLMACKHERAETSGGIGNAAHINPFHEA